MSLYADNSALVKLLIREDGSAAAVREIGSHHRIYCSSITYAEVCAALGRAHRQGRLNETDTTALVQIWSGLWGNLLRIQVDEDIVRRAGALALELGLRGYAAVHVASVLTVQDIEPLSIASWDFELRAAAGTKMVPVFPEKFA